MTKLAPEWVRTSDPVIRSPARYRWTTAPTRIIHRGYICRRQKLRSSFLYMGHNVNLMWWDDTLWSGGICLERCHIFHMLKWPSLAWIIYTKNNILFHFHILKNLSCRDTFPGILMCPLKTGFTVLNNHTKNNPRRICFNYHKNNKWSGMWSINDKSMVSPSYWALKVTCMEN